MQGGNARSEQAGLCPHCHSPDIRVRRQRHRQMLWRCRNCNRVFATPAIGAVNPAEWPNIDLVRPLWIPAMERGARQQQGEGDQTQRGNFGCGCLFIVLIVVGVASFFAISRNADFPGADTLRTAGQEVSQRLGGNGDTEEELPTPARTIQPTPARTIPLRNIHPAQRHHEYKAYMLELINEERVKAGVPPVTLGDNIAAQLHAEASLAGCFSSHWGIDGLKPYMRYSLAGGYQANAENGSGSDYCIKAWEGYRALGNIEAKIRETMDGWMESPGHRRNLLDQRHKNVNIGLAWNRFNFAAYQHFEGDYVEFNGLPDIEGGILSLAGQVKNGASFDRDDYIDVNVYYDPPPHRTIAK